MKILAVCGFGMGSSMVLRFTIEKAVAALGMDAEVDVILTSPELVNQLKGSVQAQVLPVRNYTDKNEVQALLASVLGGAA